MPSVRTLRDSVTDEAFAAIGLTPGSWKERLARPLFNVPAGRFANLASAWDAQIAEHGAVEGCRWLLPRLAKDVQARGIDQIPREGPVLLVANHPGAFDGVVIIANLPRDNLKFIVSDSPFLRLLQAARDYMIYMNWVRPQERTRTIRDAIRWLQTGGLLILYPSGLVNPDPACLPGVEGSLEIWSSSVEFFLRKVPGTRLVCTAISGVITSQFLNNPLARSQKNLEQRIKTAEYLEFAQLMLIQRDLGLSPRLTFDQPFTVDEILHITQTDDLHQAIIERERWLLADHQSAFY